ncbi:hypothetical protein C8J57DRAFT_1303109 [Mycena rebaudengoi]|nr:hypothetical protein C8J57DRAFT_1303109 [Mycena rebaudengoi]
MVSSVAVIAGLGNGSGTGAAAARLFAKEGYTVALISRGAESLETLANAINNSGGHAEAFPVSAYGSDEITAAFSAIHSRYPVAIFNAAHAVWKPFLDITPEDIRESNKVNIEGSFAFARVAILAFQKNTITEGTGKKGTLVFTGATASLRGNVITSAIASGKFALAKEFGKQNIHAIIATANNRGEVERKPTDPVENLTPNSKLSPESIAASYLYLAKQDSSAWTWELDLRPAHEKW